MLSESADWDKMAATNKDAMRMNKIDQIFATFDCNHDGALSKVRPKQCQSAIRDRIWTKESSTVLHWPAVSCYEHVPAEKLPDALEAWHVRLVFSATRR